MQIHERKMRFGGRGDNDLGERLIRQILDGIKTATCDLKCLCSAQEIADLKAAPGWFETVVDADENPRCNVRIVRVYETPFGNPDPRLVSGEGDGADAEKFKRDHAAWFAPLLKAGGLPPLTNESPLIAWEFELLEQFA